MANIPPNDPVVDTKLSPTLNDSHDDDAHSDKESQVASNDAHSTPTVRSDTTPVPPRIPYSIYSSRQKWTIALLATSVGMFSPLGANIYFPAIPSLSDAFHRTVQDINLTVTIYMVFQGITPSLWGAVADSYGRRPSYIYCILIFAVAQLGLALTPTSAYWLLLVLRCVSAAGSAPVVALGAGTVGDIAEPFERGKYMGVVTLGPMLGPCIGPVFGGLLNQHWGWRSIFWFLLILAASALIPFTLFFPETLRALVGNGSIPAKGMNRTLWSVIKEMKGKKGDEPDEDTKKLVVGTGARKEINPFKALPLFLEKDVVIILFYNAFNYTAFYAVTTTLAVVLEDNYGLSTSKSGLAYLPIGVGMVFSTIITGRLQDRTFKATRRKVERKKLLAAKAKSLDDVEKGAQTPTVDISKPLDPNDLLDFPLEHARLQLQPTYSLIFWASTIAYGWLVEKRVNLVAPLIVQFIVGWTCVSVMQINQVILVDMFPGRGASITANNNLCRCLVGAVGTALVNPITRAVGTGWTMVIFTSIPIVFSPLMLLEWKQGMKWRRARAEKVRVKKEKELEAEAVTRKELEGKS